MISPNCSKPLLDQYVKTQEGGEVDLISLDIAGKPIDIDAHFHELDGNPNTKVLKYPISESEIITNGAGERCTTYRRIYKFKQNLANEPFIATNIQRFTKGLVVEAKVNVGYKLYFKRFGIKGQEDHTGISVAQGYTRWVLAQTGDLLLPGESYIIMILKV
jgi:hypothetical protein